jgi:tetratricopeptide (TPR) repeat protein
MNRKSVFLTFLISLLALVVFSSLSSPVTAQKTSDPQDSKPTTTNASPEDAAEAEPVKNADYWFDKGALCATYGNDSAAIKFFQKAITLDPKRSGAYFTQGISYGQLDEFDKAIALLDKALSMEPQNGLFIYGRGRVHLLAGDKVKAMADFRKAAELDDEDAQAYLKWIGPKR